MGYLKNPEDKLVPQRHVPARDVIRVTDPSHTLFDPRVLEPADPELVASIREKGQLVALICRTDGKDPDGRVRYQMIAGRRRHAALLVLDAEARAAAGTAGEDPEAVESGIRVAIKVIECSDAEAFDLMIAENLQRKDYSPIEEAKLLQRSRDMGRTMEEALRPFGKSPAWGYERLELLKLDDSVQAKVRSGEIVPSAAVKLADTPRAEQKAILAGLEASGEKPTIANLKKAADPDKPARIKPAEMKAWMTGSARMAFKALFPTQQERAIVAFLITGDRNELLDFPAVLKAFDEMREKAKQPTIEAPDEDQDAA